MEKTLTREAVDVAVVGGGPAGSIAAKKISQKDTGKKVVLFEEHTPERQKVKCAGLLSKSGLKKLKINVEGKDFTLNKIRGARLYSPFGTVVEVNPQDYKAYVVDRRGFDSYLIDEAADSGVEVNYSRVEDVKASKDKAGEWELRVKTSGSVNECDRLVLAAGTDYNLHRSLNINMPKEFLIGAQYEMKIECAPDFVELHFVIPDFFAWVIPTGDGYARIGLCAKSNPAPYLEDFIRKLESEKRVKSRSVREKVFGVIPIYSRSLKTDFDFGVRLIGDAAAQVKATTGGGVVMGGLAAEHIAGEDYEEKWRNAIGGELYTHLMVRRFMSRLSPKSIDSLFRILNEGRKSLEEKGDMDLASKTLMSLASNPKVIAKFLVHSPSFIMDALF